MVDEQTLEDLEFTTIREWLKEFSISPTAQKRLAELSPVSNITIVQTELLKLNELKSIRTEGETFPRLEFEELGEEIKLLPIKNASIKLEGFMKIRQASSLCNQLILFFNKKEQDYPLLSEALDPIYQTDEIIMSIDRVFDKHGNVRDDASEVLADIRNKLRAIKKQINKNFDKELRKLLKDNLLGDTRETYINDRRVLTILSSHKRKISGSVVGSSKTGSLTYIEPQVNIALNNEFELLQDDERKEIFKILLALKDELHDHTELIKGYQDVLIEFDFINSKCRLAIKLECNLPSLSEELEFEIFEAYHPILWLKNRALGKKTLPQYLSMNKFARMLVISGPNAGGKSITLKSIGLLQVMLQSGLLVPVGPNSTMCFFQNILSDIGDNQSITNELSTYSYRLKRMNEFLQIANKKTLFLLDEFGTGSDPELGGALAEVIFEELYNKKSFGVITTHYNNIKLKADQLKNALNGSMLFNTETLEPTYKFTSGQPGSSFTFEVAKMNGIPPELIERAKEKLDDKKVKMDRLLNDLQKEKTYLEKLNHEHIEAQDIAEEARIKYDEKRASYDRKLQQLKDNSEVHQKLNQSGKKMLSYINQYNTSTRKKSVNDKLLEEVRKYLAVEKSKIENAKRIEKSKLISNSAKSSSKKKLSEKDDYNRHKIISGSKVKLISTKQIGTVEEIKDNKVTVSFGFARMKVDLNRLMWVK